MVVEDEARAGLVEGRAAPTAKGDGVNRFPLAVAWTTLPCISWILPTIGHTGICSSDGAVHDFAGPYHIGKDNMMCGPPKKIWQLSLDDMKGKSVIDYDRAVAHGDDVYRGRMHNIFCDNCHSHVACCLNEMNYLGRSNWNMVSVWFYVTVYGKYTSPSTQFWTYLPVALACTFFYLVWFR